MAEFCEHEFDYSKSKWTGRGRISVCKKCGVKLLLQKWAAKADGPNRKERRAQQAVERRKKNG